MSNVVPIRIRYAHDDRPGLARVRRGKAFVYRRPGGDAVTDGATLMRIRKLAIPPAWTNVWIARDPAAHLQATGRDARGRKQYRYHEQWTAQRDQAKYEHLLEFARVLPTIRHAVTRDLAAPPLSHEHVVATVVALLERTHIRVGNDEYARDNHSYGLTTLRNRHVRTRNGHLEFKFKGKSGVRHTIAIEDASLAREVRKCQELPGQLLFEYRDPSGRARKLSSSHVNRYLATIAGHDVTAKDFRTWWGTVSAAVELRRAGVASSQRIAKRTVLGVIDQVARQLGNTRAVCHKGYIHPHILEAYDRGVVLPSRAPDAKRMPGLNADERSVVALLEKMRRGQGRLAA